MSPRAEPPDASPGAFGVYVVAVSLLCLVLAVAWPQAAEMLLRILLALVAIGYLLHRAYGAELPEAMTHDAFSPFQGPSAAPDAKAAPGVIRTLTRELEAVDDPAQASRWVIPLTVGRTLRRAAARRLADHHGLRLDRAEDHPAIRDLVSEPTWMLIEPAEAAGSVRTAGSGPSTLPTGETVPLSRLRTILDDLERL